MGPSDYSTDSDLDDDGPLDPDDGDDEDAVLQAEGDHDNRNEPASMEATRYALIRPRIGNAYAKAPKEDLAECEIEVSERCL